MTWKLSIFGTLMFISLATALTDTIMARRVLQTNFSNTDDANITLNTQTHISRDTRNSVVLSLYDGTVGSAFMRYHHTSRVKRDSVVSWPWYKNTLKWGLSHEHNLKNKMSFDQTEAVLSHAISLWQKVLPFIKVIKVDTKVETPDVLVSFYEGDHHDGTPFDGYRGTMAHTVVPLALPKQGREVHFDSGEKWSPYTDNNEMRSLFGVAVHEFGHVFGLADSNITGTVMVNPYEHNPLQGKIPEGDLKNLLPLYQSQLDEYYKTLNRSQQTRTITLPRSTTPGTTTTSAAAHTTPSRVKESSNKDYRWYAYLTMSKGVQKLRFSCHPINGSLW